MISSRRVRALSSSPIAGVSTVRHSTSSQCGRSAWPPRRSPRDGSTAELIEWELDGQVRTSDQAVRPETTPESLAGLRTVFRDDGRVTAGTSSPICDGAAGVVVASRDATDRHGLKPRARILDQTTVGVDPIIMLTGPDPGHEEAARTQQSRRSMTSTSSRSMRPSAQSFWPGRRNSNPIWIGSTSTAARSPSVIPSARRAPGCSRRCWRRWNAGTSNWAWSPCAAVGAWERRPSCRDWRD